MDKMIHTDFDPSLFPLKGEEFMRKAEIATHLIELRAKRRIAIGADIKRRSHRTWVYWSCAAALLLAAGLSVFFSSVAISTGNSDLTASLPDNSQVVLKHNTSLSFNRILWIFSRSVSLEGTAYFHVSKGSKFSVATVAGDVAVLGTKFRVAQQSDVMMVNCYEGHVLVTSSSGDETVLNPGDSVTCSPRGIVKPKPVVKPAPVQPAIAEEIPEPEPAPVVTKKEPAPAPQRTTYTATSLSSIADKMEKRFGYVIINKNLCNGITYSGSFYNDDKDMTAEIVFGSSGLDYTISGDTITLSAPK